MGRKAHQPRAILPDPKYKEVLVAKFVNILMKDGKKSIAEKIIYGALDIAQAKLEEEPLKIFKKAIENVKPQVEVKSRRVGGANYQVPCEVRPQRRGALSFRWIIEASRARSEKNMMERLAGELVDAYNQRGGAMKKREDVHRMADANKAFSHFRF